MIRRVVMDDLHRVSALIANTLLISASGQYTLEQIESLTTTYSEAALEALAGRGRVRLHVSDDRVDGMICLQNESIQALFVSPDRQRHGVGRALVEWAEYTAREHGREHLRVAASLTAVGFYERMGFAAQGPGRTGANVRIVHMIKPLKQPAR